MNKINQFIYDLVGMSVATQFKVLITFIIIVVLIILRFFIYRMVWQHTDDIKIRYQWKRMLSFIIPFVGLLLIVIVWASAFHQFGAFLGLITAGLAIALKDPLTNLAGWIFILFRRPFAVGDRIQVGKYTGDVIDIRHFQFTLLEIGNWVQADQSTGRIIHLPNGKVFMEPQANYTDGFKYIWDELPVLITFESDWETAKLILQDVVKKYAEKVDHKAKHEIMEASKNYMIYYNHLTPIVYTSVKDSGVLLTIRYLCSPHKRRGTENNMWEAILKRFDQSENVNLAYPTTRFYTEER